MNMKRLVWIKACHLLLAGTVCMGFASCSDDEQDLVTDGGFEYETPANDVVETTVEAKAVVFAGGEGDLSSLFVKRLDNRSVTPVITDDTELVVLDEASAADFLKDTVAFNTLRDFYSRGGIIYMDRPAMQQGAIVARLQLGVYNEVPDELIDPLYEAYIFRNDGSEKMTENLYRPEPHEVILTDSLGNEYSEIRSDEAKPGEYLYGRFAESSAEFINRLTDNATVRSRSADDSFIELPIVLQAKDFKLEPKFLIPGLCAVMGKVEAYIRSVHVLESGKDLYHVMLKESFPGHLSWKGEGYYGIGISYGGVTVDTKFSDTQYQVSDLYSPTPSNESPTGEDVMVETWNVTGKVGNSMGSVGNISPYRSRTQITLPVKDMNYKYTRNSDSHLTWTYKIDGVRDNGANSYIAPAAIGKKACDTYQAWGWSVENTGKSERTFDMKADFTFYLCFISIQGYHRVTFREGNKQSFTFKLPAPRRKI